MSDPPASVSAAEEIGTPTFGPSSSSVPPVHARWLYEFSPLGVSSVLIISPHEGGDDAPGIEKYLMSPKLPTS